MFSSFSGGWHLQTQVHKKNENHTAMLVQLPALCMRLEPFVCWDTHTLIPITNGDPLHFDISS